jgi:putative addiction module killer protein
MVELIQSDEFRNWINSLRDNNAFARITNRLERLQEGNPGDVKPVGSGISELRVNFGPGYRVYFMRRGAEIIILLCGGDKSTQPKDIAKAKAIAERMKD